MPGRFKIYIYKFVSRLINAFLIQVYKDKLSDQCKKNQSYNSYIIQFKDRLKISN